MKEVIWVLLADKISTFLIILTVFTGIVGGVLFILSCTMDPEYDFNNENSWKLLRNFGKGFLIAFAVFLPLSVFSPTSKEVVTIMGVGTAIEYARGNETIRQLPDKAILAIDAFLDDYVDTEQTKD